MKRYRMSISAVLLWAILAGSIPVAAQQDVYTVYVNGVKVSGAHPLLRDGIAYLPANSLAQALGVSIQWDSRLNIVKINDQVTGARPLSENGTLMLPIEAVAQALNGTVEWDGRNQAIRVSSRPSVGGTPVASRTTSPPSSTTSVVSPPPASTTSIVVSPPPVVAVNPVPASTGGYTTTTYPTPTTTTYPASTTTTYPAATASSGGGYPNSTSNVPYPSPAAYPPSTTSSSNPPPIRPPSAPPRMPSGLELPPAGTENGPPLAGNVPYSSGSVYVPKSVQNNVFAVTVTNIETVNSIKDFYHPRPGYRFVIVYLSQQNVSNEVQIYTGRFSLLDQSNHSFDYVEGLSNFWLVILRPYGINFGYLVFEMPVDAHPTRLALHALNQSPLTLNL